MEQIPVRALNQDTAGVLARVQSGQVVEIIRRGRAVARIVPVVDDELSDLISAGIVLAPTAHRSMTMPVVPMSGGPDAGSLLEQLRAEERW